MTRFCSNWKYFYLSFDVCFTQQQQQQQHASSKNCANCFYVVFSVEAFHEFDSTVSSDCPERCSGSRECWVLRRSELCRLISGMVLVCRRRLVNWVEKFCVSSVQFPGRVQFARWLLRCTEFCLFQIKRVLSKFCDVMCFVVWVSRQKEFSPSFEMCFLCWVTRHNELGFGRQFLPAIPISAHNRRNYSGNNWAEATKITKID